MRGEKGFALVLTLVVTALMVAAAVELIHQVYVDTSLNRNFRDGQQASLLAESGLYGGIRLLRMALSSQDGYTSLSDTWAAPFKQEDETGRIEITVTEESGKINLNALVNPDNTVKEETLNILKRLGTPLQIPESAWNALADWIDTDDLPVSGGSESPYYLSLSPPYSAHNGRLTTVNELTLVKGFTPEMVAKLAPFVTIYADQPGSLVAQSVRVNVNTAPKEVIMALDSDIDEGLAERVIEERNRLPFTNSDTPGSRVNNSLFDNLPSRDKVTLIYKGTLFRITARGFVKDAARTVEAVVRMDGTPEILSWQEY
ncbi:type II secretion system minor pseudopilin GspK [Geobacter sp. AOG2]|uniref:type II secretion system minor pseudopilin GspK n=1 Tax=Geobacter sp. AOG2 TaxID=1566347 RepID=UPI001CC80991|nr:type II secretion system minor pseudopilin GspK [Geobacter sp. AOG2]GFE59469.1 type II secretion system protein K [Geobacter sp. AOG2]